MPIRNPFARRPGAIAVQDENQRPGSAAGKTDAASPGFEKVDTVGSMASAAFSIRSRRSQDTGEYKMSVVNDSGVYLPPSPIEKEATWPRRYLSRTSSDKSSVSASGEIEHFPISRESFDSYRRSFDICAKSPVIQPVDSILPPRQSLDSKRFPGAVPRSALSLEQQRLRQWQFEREPPTPEENFEDVGLNDSNENKQQPQKKRGFFAKFGGDAAPPSPTAPHDQTSAGGGGTAVSRFLPLPGRKRAQSGSGQGAELGAIPVIMVSAGLDKTPAAPPAAALQSQEVQS
ncbi:Pal1 cell morphology protein-domain-containing protein [Madurella fahalii]|uniref:Pal1 cell morphology protein-domain-containing protein n=1 Tax=Madurella fahalii TaxID=1157608 RepID=A0ABQ0G0W2_9PEZI